MSSTPALPELAEIDRRFAFHPFTALATHERQGPTAVMVRGEGVWLQDATGRRFLDGMAGLWCVNAGYGRRELANALREQAETLPYCHAFSSLGSDKPALLAQELIARAPAPMSKVFFGNSGSDANDTQVKLVWYYNNVLGRPKKKKIIARQRGYHGVTLVAASLTGLPGLHAGFDLPLEFVRHTTVPHKLWHGAGLTDAQFAQKLARDLQELIEREGADTIAAMIVEPVMGAGGVIVPPPGYYAAIQPILREHDILLIADEVICGFGRLGTMFGCEAMGFVPDLITIAKGLTSAYFPLSGVMVSERVWRTLVEGSARYGVFGHGYTYSAHPIGAAVGLANLALLERDNLFEAARLRGSHLHTRLRAAFADHPMVADIRGFGLIGAIELCAKRDPLTPFDSALAIAGRVARAAFARGVITRALPSSDTLAFSPPFVISEREVDMLVNGVRDALDEVRDELVSEGKLR